MYVSAAFANAPHSPIFTVDPAAVVEMGPGEVIFYLQAIVAIDLLDLFSC